MKMGLNEVEVSPHGLILDNDEATGCPMPLEALPTLFKVVSSPCSSIFDQNPVKPDLPDFFPIYPFKGTPPVWGPPLESFVLVAMQG